MGTGFLSKTDSLLQFSMGFRQEFLRSFDVVLTEVGSNLWRVFGGRISSSAGGILTGLPANAVQKPYGLL